MGVRYFGAAVPRVEDPRLLRGAGRYTDDIRLPGTLHAAFVRSPHAHARIVKIDTREARAQPGVAGVFSSADFGDVARRPLPHMVPVYVVKQPFN